MTAAKGSQIPVEPPFTAAELMEALKIYGEEAIASGSKARLLEAMIRMLDVAGLCVGSLADKLPAAASGPRVGTDLPE